MFFLAEEQVLKAKKKYKTSTAGAAARMIQERISVAVEKMILKKTFEALLLQFSEEHFRNTFFK